MAGTHPLTLFPLTEQLIVVPTIAGRYIVYEGNCRTACLKKLSEEKDSFTNAPALVITDPSFSQDTKAVLLSAMHVVPKIKWSSFDKARLISDLVETHKKSPSWTAHHLRMHPLRVNGLLLAYKHTRKFLSDTGTKVQTPFNELMIFGYFEEFFCNKTLAKKAAKDAFVVSQFIKWIEEGRFSDPHSVRKLPKVMNSRKGIDEMLKDGGTVDSAYALLIKTNPEIAVPLLRSTRRLTDRFLEPSENDLDGLQSNPNGSAKALNRLYRTIPIILRRLEQDNVMAADQIA